MPEPSFSACHPRQLAAAAIVFACVVFAPSAGSAAAIEVTAMESSVRSAPFDVAPEVLRLHAGDKISADDQPQGAWRRVRLPNGHYGYLHDADVKVTADPLPGPTAVGAVADTGPNLSAPPPSPSPPPPPPPSHLPGSSESPTAVAVQPAPQPSQPSQDQTPTGPTLAGVMFEIQPVGTLAATSAMGAQSANASNDSVFAVAVAPFVDVPLSPQFALGLSPKVIFRVKADGSTGESGKEFDLRARLTGRLPLSPDVRVFGRLSPAFSLISFPAASAGATSIANPQGLLIDVAVGAEVALLPNLFLVGELGYQVGFQTSSSSDGSATFDGTRYLHLGGGLAIGL